MTVDEPASSPANGRILVVDADEEQTLEMRPGQRFASELQIDELLRLLTQRVQNRGLDEEEAPPSYSHGEN